MGGKNMKKWFICILIIYFLSVFLCGCLEKYIIEDTGTIVFNDFEGGFYGIISDEFHDEENKFDPINLPSEFKVDGLRVKFKAFVTYGQSSYHMWGTIIRILEIEILDNI
jgi:hypothetical protein